jgi:hypothetical protein
MTIERTSLLITRDKLPTVYLHNGWLAKLSCSLPSPVGIANMFFRPIMAVMPLDQDQQ